MLYCSYMWRKRFAKEEPLDPTAQLRPGMNQVMELSHEHGVVGPMVKITAIVVPNLANTPSTQIVSRKFFIACNIQSA
jgi:hypothetical protein